MSDGPDRIGKAATRTFLALCVLTARDGRATMDSIAAERCLHRMTVYEHLKILRAAGLVEIGKGTTRPACEEIRLVRPAR